MLDAYNVKFAKSVKPDAHAISTINGDAVDTAGYDDVMVLFDAGTFTATGTADVTVQESADGSTGWAAIPGAVFPQVTTASDDAIFVGQIRADGVRLRHFRAVAVIGAAVCDLAVSFLLGRKNFTVGSASNATFTV